MNAFPLNIPPDPTAARRLTGGMAVAAAVILSIWLLVVAAFQQQGTLVDTTPAPLPGAPSLVEAEAPVPGIEIIPAPGADITPR